MDISRLSVGINLLGCYNIFQKIGLFSPKIVGWKRVANLMWTRRPTLGVQSTPDRIVPLAHFFSSSRVGWKVVPKRVGPLPCLHSIFSTKCRIFFCRMFLHPRFIEIPCSGPRFFVNLLCTQYLSILVMDIFMSWSLWMSLWRLCTLYYTMHHIVFNLYGLNFAKKWKVLRFSPNLVER